MHRKQCIVLWSRECIDKNTMHIKQYIDYNAHRIQHKEYNAQIIMPRIQCIEYKALSTMHKIQCIEYIA